MLYIVESVLERGHWKPDHECVPNWVPGAGHLNWQRTGEYTITEGVRAPNRWSAYWRSKKTSNYARMIRQVVRAPVITDYHTYELREGDGNMGTHRLGTIRAVDMSEAVRLAKRRYLFVPRGAETDGDDLHTSICTYSSRLDYCPYVAEVILVE